MPLPLAVVGLALLTGAPEGGGGRGGRSGGTSHYVSPSGASAADGTMARPWDLATALAGAGGRIAPGDTIWLRGGTYRGAVVCRAHGAAGARGGGRAGRRRGGGSL